MSNQLRMKGYRRFSRLCSVGLALWMTVASAIGQPAQAQSPTIYIRPGATGNGSGSDWTNALTVLPATLARGATYYLADGSYSGYTFDDPASGTQAITIKKATVADHGTDLGWNNTYGDGQSVFAGALHFATSYYVLDGQTGGGPQSWTSGHGFEIAVDTSTDAISTAPVISYIAILHIAVTQLGNTISPGPGAGGTAGNAFKNSSTANNMLFSYVYFHHLKGLPLFMRGGSDMIIEYSYFSDPCGMSLFDANDHCEHLVTHGYDNLIARYNVFKDIRSTGGLVNNDGVSENWEIYGNVFYRTAGSALLSVAADPADHSLNFRIFNNSFVQGGELKLIMDNSNHLIYNNIVYDGGMYAFPAAHDYNYFSKATSLRCDMDFAPHENGTRNYPNNCDALTTTADPFVNVAGENFALRAPLSGWSGVNVCTLPGVTCDAAHPYDKDAFGNTRGADGVWDRGAFEYAATVTDLRVSNAIAAGGTLTATLNWTPPAGAVTTTLRYSSALITDANWAGATLLTATLPGNANSYMSTMPYTGGTVYFALKTQDATGAYSPLSNNAFWPSWKTHLPLVRK